MSDEDPAHDPDEDAEIEEERLSSSNPSSIPPSTK
jgi:hypothetical protein